MKTIDPLVNIMPCNVPIVARNVCDMTFVLLNIIPPWYSPRPVIMCSELGAIICHRGASHVDIRRHQSHHHRHNRYCGLSGDSMRTNQIKKHSHLTSSQDFTSWTGEYDRTTHTSHTFTGPIGYLKLAGNKYPNQNILLYILN